MSLWPQSSDAAVSAQKGVSRNAGMLTRHRQDGSQERPVSKTRLQAKGTELQFICSCSEKLPPSNNIVRSAVYGPPIELQADSELSSLNNYLIQHTTVPRGRSQMPPFYR